MLSAPSHCTGGPRESKGGSHPNCVHLRWTELDAARRPSVTWISTSVQCQVNRGRTRVRCTRVCTPRGLDVSSVSAAPSFEAGRGLKDSEPQGPGSVAKGDFPTGGWGSCRVRGSGGWGSWRVMVLFRETWGSGPRLVRVLNVFCWLFLPIVRLLFSATHDKEIFSCSGSRKCVKMRSRAKSSL